jgi:hypothetical protein
LLRLRELELELLAALADARDGRRPLLLLVERRRTLFAQRTLGRVRTSLLLHRIAL